MKDPLPEGPRLEAASIEPRRAVARNALNLVLGQAATTALAIVLNAALGRYLGAKDFGLLYLISTMSTFAYVFAEWGQPFFVIRQVARDPGSSAALLGTALALRVGFAILVTLPAWLVGWALGYELSTRWLAVFLILATLPLFLAQGCGMVFRARDQMGLDATVSVSNKAMALALTLPALSLGLGIPGVVVAQGIAGLAALGMALFLYRRQDGVPLHASSRIARDLLAGGAPILAMTAAISVQPYLDVVILSKLAPVVVVGWFGAAKSILGTLMAPATILGAAAYPSIARASADPVALRKEVRSALRPLLWLGGLAGTGTYLFAATVVGLIYGSRGFGPAATILEVFAPGLFLLFIDILLGNVIYASGRGTGFAVAKILSVVVGTGLDIALIPIFQERFNNGGIGVMVAFALSEVVVFIGSMFVLRRGTLTLETALDVGRAVGAAGATVLLFRMLPLLPPWVGIPLCVVAFAVASFLLGLMGWRDLALLSTVLRRRPSAIQP